MGINIATSHPYRLFLQQGISFVLGLLLFLGALEFPVPRLKTLSPFLLIISIILLILVFIPGIGVSRESGSHIPRWIGIPLPGMGTVTFQPVELAKLAIVLFLAAQLSVSTERNLRAYTKP